MKFIQRKKHEIFIFLLGVLIGIFVVKVDWDNFYPKSSSDLAAWIQALGALLALFVAIWVSSLPLKNEKKNVVNLLRLSYKTTLESFLEAKIGLEKEHLAMIKMARVCLEEQIIMSRSIKAELLPIPQLMAHNKIQLFSAQLVYYIEKAEKEDFSKYSQEMKYFLNHLLDEIKKISPFVFSDVNGAEAFDFNFDNYCSEYKNHHVLMASKIDGLK